MARVSKQTSSSGYALGLVLFTAVIPGTVSLPAPTIFSFRSSLQISIELLLAVPTVPLALIGNR